MALPISPRTTSDICSICNNPVYSLSKLRLEDKVFHKECFVCITCNEELKINNNYVFQLKYYCKQHYDQKLSQVTPSYKAKSPSVDRKASEAIHSSPTSSLRIVPSLSNDIKLLDVFNPLHSRKTSDALDKVKIPIFQNDRRISNVVGRVISPVSDLKRVASLSMDESLTSSKNPSYHHSKNASETMSFLTDLPPQTPLAGVSNGLTQISRELHLLKEKYAQLEFEKKNLQIIIFKNQESHKNMEVAYKESVTRCNVAESRFEDLNIRLLQALKNLDKANRANAELTEKLKIPQKLTELSVVESVSVSEIIPEFNESEIKSVIEHEVNIEAKRRSEAVASPIILTQIKEEENENENDIINENKEETIVEEVINAKTEAKNVASIPLTVMMASSLVRVASPSTSEFNKSTSESRAASPSEINKVPSLSVSSSISKLESIASPSHIRIPSNSVDSTKSSRVTALVKTLESNPAILKMKSPSSSRVVSPVGYNLLGPVHEHQISPRVVSSPYKAPSSTRRSVTTRAKLAEDDTSNFVADILYEDDLEEMSRNYLSYAFTIIDKKNAAPATHRFNTYNSPTKIPHIRQLSSANSATYTDSDSRDRRNSSFIFNKIASRDFVKDLDLVESDEEDIFVDKAPIMSASEAAALDRSNELQQEGLKLPSLLEWLEKKSPTLLVGWQSRYCAVADFNLYYAPFKFELPFPTDPEQNKALLSQLNCVPLLVVKSIAARTFKSKDQDDSSFEVEARDSKTGELRIYLFRSRNTAIRDKWVKGLNQHREHLIKMLTWTALHGKGDINVGKN